MRAEIPTTDIRANPHIQSKIGVWKNNYYSLTNILDRSGVGFNLHNDFKIDCSDDQWDQIVKVWIVVCLVLLMAFGVAFNLEYFYPFFYHNKIPMLAQCVVSLGRSGMTGKSSLARTGLLVVWRKELVKR